MEDEAAVVLPPDPVVGAPPGRVRFRSTGPVVVVGAQERRRLGLDMWVDGTMGVHRDGRRTLVVSPNGGRLAVHELTHGGFLHGCRTPVAEVVDRRSEMDHASGGPLLHDPDRGLLVLVYHGERFTGGDPLDYWSFIGMAVSRDDGATFRDLGPVVTPHHAEHDPDRPRPVEIGSGAAVVRDGQVHLYFQDRGIVDLRRNLCVARAPVTEVFDAAAEGRAPSFRIYGEGGFDEPGLGGQPADLLAGRRPSVLWFDAAYLEACSSFLLVYSCVLGVEGGTGQWMHMASLSPDGLTWGAAHPLYAEPVPAELLYLSVDSGGADQRTINGHRFQLYRVRAEARWRWDDARLERVTVTVDGC